MSRRTLRYTVVGLAFFLVGLVHYLPASIAVGWVATRTPLEFDGVTGSVFNGRAAYASLPEGGIDNLRWHVHPLGLLLGRLSADVAADTDLDGVSATLTRTLLGANRVRNLTGQATLGWLAKLGGYTFIPTSGRLNIDIDTLDFNDDLDISDLAGHLNLTDARYELLNPPVALGRFRIDLDSTDPANVRAAVVDSPGALDLTGHADLLGVSRYRLDVRLRARAGADDRLKRLMTQLGTPDDDGWYHITERGRL